MATGPEEATGATMAAVRSDRHAWGSPERGHASSNRGAKFLPQRGLTMNMHMRALILGAAIGIAAAVTTISPTHAGMIGAGKLHITEPASLAEPVRGRRFGRQPIYSYEGSPIYRYGFSATWPDGRRRLAR